MLWKLKLLNLWIIISKWCAISTSIHFSLNKKCLAGKEIKINDVVNPHPEVVVYLKPAARNALDKTKGPSSMWQCLRSVWVTYSEFLPLQAPQIERYHCLSSIHKCLSISAGWDFSTVTESSEYSSAMDFEDWLRILRIPLGLRQPVDYLVFQMKLHVELSLPKLEVTNKAAKQFLFYVF